MSSERDAVIARLEDDQFAIAMMLVRRDTGALSGDDMPAQQLKTLFVVRALHEPTAHDIALRLDVSAATTSGLLHRLEDRGYITRRPSPTDRRARIIEVTPSGDQFLHEMLTMVRNTSREIIDGLTMEELTALAIGTAAVRREAERLERGQDS
ncbi:MarR family winged helix-turn-helix transcriptional regulator [uncultured Aeromicrobium sp.]|uniref:MarR family winged helix-turn-helix transcriptional regulator n=1 Tax=uncultured Aeromicrobium sp. TaxID=337820 RepID=UPI0025CE083B|nr:MarR family transcriptional regulator [uncultured Aeromicrobium sp.]